MSSVHAETENEAQVWTALAGTARLGERSTGPALWLDLHLRRGDAGTVHISRPGVGWQLSSWLSVWAGYGWIPVLLDESDTIHEHRLWQQVILAHKPTQRLSLQSRTRFEQRFVGSGDDAGFRVREFVRVGYVFAGDFGLVAWDELFLGLNEPDWGAPDGLDQNRLFVGGSVQIREEMRLEMGYLSVFLDRGDADILAHVLATNLFLSL